MLSHTCLADKSVKNFKKVKKEIDTLVLLPMVIDFVALNKKGGITKDEQNRISIQSELQTQIKKLLSKKYIIKNAKSEDANPANFRDSLYILLEKLNTKQKSIESIQVPLWLDKLTNEGRYFLLFRFAGHYTQGTNAKDIITRNKIFISSTYPTGMEVTVLLYDNLNKRFIYYKTETRKEDPRSDEFRRLALLKTIRKIYYK